MTMDQLANTGEETHPAASSTAEATRPNAEAATAKDSASPADEFEDEPRVPVHVLIETRRKLRDAETKAQQFETMANEYASRLSVWNNAVPEIEELIAKRTEGEKEIAKLKSQIEYLQQVEAMAKDQGIELPDDSRFKMDRLLVSLTDRLEKLERLPDTFEQKLTSFTSNYEAQQRQRSAMEEQARTRNELSRKFNDEWDKIVSVAPEVDDLRDVMFERYSRDGGKKPVEEYAGNLVKLAKTARGRSNAERQAAAESAPRPVAGGSTTSSPRDRSDALPSNWRDFWKQNRL